MKAAKQQAYEHFNHRRLWAAAEAQIDVIPRSPGYMAKHFHMASVLLMHFALEGYLNWLLSYAAPDIWVKERAFFNRPPYLGAFGKCSYLLTLLEITDYSPSNRPLSTVRELDALRRRLVHPKPERGVRVVHYDHPKGPPVHVSRLDRIIRYSLVERVRTDYRLLAGRMHEEAESSLGLALGTAEPFSPLMGFQRTEI